MTASPDVAAMLEDLAEPDIEDLPEAESVVSPATLEQASVLLRHASDEKIPCLFWGGGTHQDQGYEVDPKLIITTRRLAALIDWQAEDLTVVVEAGMPVADLNARLVERNQTAVLPESPGLATVGGAVAAAVSSWPRLRYGPIRDRMLQTRLVTGDGRVVTAGGRVVKNVTGYDIPRLVTGSHGALGLIGAVCLKLWPAPAFTATVAVEDVDHALATAYRPLAVIETTVGCRVYLGGTEADVHAQAAKLESPLSPGITWPSPLSAAHQWSLRVPPRLTVEAVQRGREVGMVDFQAAHGVGDIRLAFAPPDPEAVVRLRSWAEKSGGSLSQTKGRLAGVDPWGAPPPSLPLQQAVKAAFDPAGVSNPGRLPGRV
jgi:glycolate oxidase FAD binding subunit